MKSIKEKLMLVKLSRDLGMPVDESILNEVTRYKELQSNLIKSVRSNSTSDLFGTKSVDKKTNTTSYPIQEEKEEINETFPVASPSVLITEPEKSLVDRAAQEIEKQVFREQDSFQQPNPPAIQPNLDAIIKKLKFLEQAISKIAITGPGGGEVNLRYLDDVDRSSISDGLFLRYNSTSKKFEFDENDHLSTLSLINQPIVNVSLAQVIDLGNVDMSNNITLGSNSTIVFSKSNSYNISPSLQLVNTSTDQQDFTMWLRKNYVDMENTTSIFTIPARKTPSIPGKLIATTPLPVQANVNDVIQIMCHSDSIDVSIQTFLGNGTPPTVPTTPGVILLVSRI
jgi:hypothetical protein